jgi:hypothetical protein
MPLEADNAPRSVGDIILGSASGVLTAAERQKLDFLSDNNFSWGIALLHPDTGETWIYVEDDTDEWEGWVELAGLKKGLEKIDEPDQYHVFWEYLDTVPLDETLCEDDLEDMEVVSWLCAMRPDLDDQDAEALAESILFDIDRTAQEDEEG